MRVLLVLTYILPNVFIGMIIGGLIFKNTTAVVWGIVLLVADIIVGICLQHVADRQSRYTWDDFDDE